MKKGKILLGSILTWLVLVVDTVTSYNTLHIMCYVINETRPQNSLKINLISSEKNQHL